MNNKIPCGGFYLSDTLGVDENGKLGVNGGEPYKSLVTDGDGGVKWEDRLAYDDRKLVLNASDDGKYIKVADEVPSWASVGAPMKVWGNNGENIPVSREDSDDLGNGNFAFMTIILFITTDNFELDGQIIPEKGVYFLFVPNDFYVAGVAGADSDTPEITWDGNIGTLKTIDQKFIPLQTIYVKATFGNEPSKVTLDKTYDEISALLSRGVDVKIVNGGNILNYTKSDTEAIYFSAYLPFYNQPYEPPNLPFRPKCRKGLALFLIFCVGCKIFLWPGSQWGARA